MSAQEFYRDHSSRPLSPRTPDATVTDGTYDRHDGTDADEQTDGIPDRVTSPNHLDALPSISNERHQSTLSDTSAYTYDEEANNPYGKNHTMANEGSNSKEALVRHGRSNSYQDLGTCFSLLPQFPPPPPSC